MQLSQYICCTILDYPVSYIELIGVLSGFASVYFAVRTNIFTWYIGLLNVVCFALIFFEIQLYADFLLQCIYFAISINGIFLWKKKQAVADLVISYSSKKDWLFIVFGFIGISFSFILFSYFLPIIFSHYALKPASYLVLDGLLSSASIIATYLMAKKKIEAWLFWIVIDFASTILYVEKNVKLIAIEFFVFGCMAIWGFVKWQKDIQN